jgi:CRISPR-associated protein Cas1
VRELVLKGFGVRVQSRKGLLVVEGEEGKLEVSPSELDQVVVVSSGISLTSGAVRLLMRHGVDLLFLDEKGEPVGRLYPPFVNRTVLTRRKQYEAYLSELRWLVVGAFVEAKIRNQANLLKYYAKSRELDELKTCAAEVEASIEKLPAALGDPQRVMSVEAEAARAYWSGFALLVPRHLGFEGRDPESPDPVNMCLNYCYRLLYSACWRALVLAGLDPYAGFLHADRSGKESLVYDYSEMFKPPAVDRMLLKLLSTGFEPQAENGLLTRDTRGQLVKAFREWVQRKARPSSGEPCTLEQAVKRWAFKLASFLRGEEREYTGFVEPW